ncbi:MAG TPA: hydroxyacylglutathione hydrolase [Hyphomicrobiaceae bacterium]|nr:hydroxyacylglutathione hydrolase [Hyphomicrobiaceae bacterium]
MSKLETHQFRCLSDNYGVLIHDAAAGVTASIDAPEAEPVRRALKEKGWKLTHILVTHHHADHTQGVGELKAEFGAKVIGAKADAGRISGLDETVSEGSTFKFGSFEVRVLETPGHTSGHITFWIPAAAVAFAGDTLFALGCGRVFEGDAQTMWRSLSKLAALPPETEVYCGHEYTLSNARFALTIEPENTALQRRATEIERLVAAGKPTLPTRIGVELETNPFLRPQSPAIRQRLGMQSAPDWQVFGEVRERKNRG